MSEDKKIETTVNQGQGIIIGQGNIEGNTFQQLNVSANDVEEMKQLVEELEVLRNALKKEAALNGNPDEQLEQIQIVSEAAKAAKVGDKKGVLTSLKSSGKWTLDTATKIGVGLATSYLKDKLGLP